MGGVVDAVSNAVSDVVDTVGNVVSDVVDAGVKVVDAVGTAIENTAQAAVNDPIGTMAKVAAVATGNVELLPLISAADVVAHGGDLQQAAIAAGTTYVAQGVANYVAADLSTANTYDTTPFSEQTRTLADQTGGMIPKDQLSNAIGAGAGGATRTALTGGNAGDILTSGLTSGAGSYVGQEVKADTGDILGKTGSTIAGNVAGAVTAGALQGKDVNQIFGSSLVNNLINTNLASLNNNQSSPSQPTKTADTGNMGVVAAQTYNDAINAGFSDAEAKAIAQGAFESNLYGGGVQTASLDNNVSAGPTVVKGVFLQDPNGSVSEYIPDGKGGFVPTGVVHVFAYDQPAPGTLSGSSYTLNEDGSFGPMNAGQPTDKATANADGTRTLSDGSISKENADGTVTVTSPNGTVETYDAKGDLVSTQQPQNTADFTKADYVSNTVQNLRESGHSESDIQSILQNTFGLSSDTSTGLIKAISTDGTAAGTNYLSSSADWSKLSGTTSGSSASGTGGSGSTSTAGTGSGGSGTGESGTGGSGTGGSGSGGSGSGDSGSGSGGAAVADTTTSTSGGSGGSTVSVPSVPKIPSSGSSASEALSYGTSGGGSSGTQTGALPKGLNPSYLSAAPVQDIDMNMSQLKQLYPQLTGVDPRILSMLTGKPAGSASGPAGTGTAFSGGALSMPSPGYPSQASGGSSQGGVATFAQSPDLMSGSYDALSAAGLRSLGALPSTGSAYGLKKGGKVQHRESTPHIPEFITGKTGHYVDGKGDGQSDDIPAMLADGEYVFDADTVAQLGNGSSKAGAQLLDHFREALRDHKRSAPSDKIPPVASPLQYMKEALKRHKG